MFFNNVFQKYLTVKNIIFFVIAVLFVVFLGKIHDIAILFFASFVISCSLEPVVKKIEPKFGRNIASVMAVSLMLIVILAFLVPMVIMGGYQVVSFSESIPNYIDNLKNFFYSVPILRNTQFAQLDIGGIITSASSMTSNVINETISLSKNVGSALVYLLASLIIIYYFLADRMLIKKTYLRLFPSQMRKRAKTIMDSISQKVGGYIVAQITTMASVGIVMTLGLLILHVDYAFLLGLLTALLDIVPVVGPAIALVICLLVSYKTGWLILSLIVVVFSVAQLLENNFVRPFVFGKFLNVHPLFIYLFLFITAKYMGIVGVIFAPALAGMAVVLMEELYMKHLD